MTDAYQLALFHRTLADLCRAEVPLGRAFRIMEGDLRRGRLREAAAAMAADVEAGTPLAEAYRKRGDDFPALYGALVEAGAAAGDLPGTLEEIARIASVKAEATARIRRILAYPLLVAVFGAGVFWFLYVFVIPPFAAIFAQITDRSGNVLALPGITRLVFALPAMIPLTLGIVAAVVLAISYLRDPVEGMRAPVGIWMRLPLLGPLRVNAALATMAATLAALLRRGLPLDRALDLVAAAADGPLVRNAATAMARGAREGSSLTDAARESGLLPPSMVWMLGTAEKQGYSERALDEIAGICRDRVTREMDTYTTILGPLMELVLGLFVGTVVLAIFYPIFRLQSALM